MTIKLIEADAKEDSVKRKINEILYFLKDQCKIDVYLDERLRILESKLNNVE